MTFRLKGAETGFRTAKASARRVLETLDDTMCGLGGVIREYTRAPTEVVAPFSAGGQPSAMVIRHALGSVPQLLPQPSVFRDQVGERCALRALEPAGQHTQHDSQRVRSITERSVYRAQARKTSAEYWNITGIAAVAAQGPSDLY